MDQIVEGQAALAVAGVDQFGLRVLADEVDQHGQVAKRLQAERDAVAGVRHVIDDLRHVDRIGHRQRQAGHMDDGIDADAARHQNAAWMRSYHASTTEVMAGSASGAPRSTWLPVRTLVALRAPLIMPAKRPRSSRVSPAFLLSTTITVCLPSWRK